MKREIVGQLTEVAWDRMRVVIRQPLLRRSYHDQDTHQEVCPVQHIAIEREQLDELIRLLQSIRDNEV